MATINIRGVPEYLKEWLRQNASANKVTMNALVIRVLQDAKTTQRERERIRRALARIQYETPLSLEEARRAIVAESPRKKRVR